MIWSVLYLARANIVGYHETETTTAAASDSASHDAICKLLINALILFMPVYKGNARVLINLQLAPIWKGIFTWNTLGKT